MIPPPDDTTTTSNGEPVLEVLKSKHPTSQPASADSLSAGEHADVHPVVFDSIDAAMIRTAALRTTGVDAKGSALPSSLPSPISGPVGQAYQHHLHGPSSLLGLQIDSTGQESAQ